MIGESTYLEIYSNYFIKTVKQKVKHITDNEIMVKRRFSIKEREELVKIGTLII